MIPPPTFSYLTNIYFDAGVLSILKDLLPQLGIQRPLVVTDRGLSALGMVDRLQIEPAAVYDGVETNPSERHINEALSLYRAHACDGLVALGGGSSMDTAKCVGLLSGHEGPLRKYAMIHGGTPLITKDVPPIVAVPTTAGSGSEVGRAALITVGESKLGFLSAAMLPKAAVCDPTLTESMGPGLTAGSGMDAISHCLEAVCSPAFNPIAEAIAMDGFERGCRALPDAFEGGASPSRREMMLCALEGGLSFQKGLGAIHSLSHPLGGLAGRELHHGSLNALFLPVVLRFNAKSCSEKLDRMAKVVGLKNGSDLPSYFEDLNSRFGLPERLRDMNVREDELEPLSKLAAQDHCCASNPRPLDAGACLDLYRSIY